MTNQFQNDLKLEAEFDIKIEDFIKKMPKVHQINKMIGNYKYFDYVVALTDGRLIKIEVKTDRKLAQSGNIVIEYGRIDFYDKTFVSSGLMESTSDLYIHIDCINNLAYIFNTKKLQETVISGNYKKITGGDGKRTHMYLIKIKDLDDLYTIHKI